MADNTQLKILHEWFIPFTKEIDVTSDETINGQVVKVTRKERKEVPVKMALKKLTRREARDADVFYGKEYNRFMKMGFMPRSIVINQHMNISGGILSEKERGDAAKLIQRQIELEADLVRLHGVDGKKDEEEKLRSELYSIKARLIDLNAANESAFQQTADVKAQNQLNLWLAFILTLIEKDGKWVSYFEGSGDTPDEIFEKRQEFMWNLEENEDEFYQKAIEKISFYVGLFTRGVSSSEQFDLIEEEMKKQLEAKQEELKKMEAEAAAKKAAETAAQNSEPTPPAPETPPEAPTA